MRNASTDYVGEISQRDDTANWCKKYWTGDSGRYCLVHSRYASCNNNMGVEVSWLDIKKACNVLSQLGVFIMSFRLDSYGRGAHEAPEG